MESTLFILLITIAALGLALLMFCGWVVVAAFRGAARLGARAIGADGSNGRAGTPARVVCPRKRCHAVNPPQARFCRRCGIALPPSKHAAPARTLPAGSPSHAGVW